MRVVVLQAGKEDKVIKDLLDSINQVLEELQVEVRQIKLERLPYYEGYEAEEFNQILTEIDQATGLVVASRVEILSVSGSLATFFEYCSNHKGSSAFKKPLFALTSSDWRGEREAAEHILHIWDILGGLEFGKVGVYAPSYSLDKEHIIANVERMVEDFYRIMKQGRIPMKSSDNLSFMKEQTEKITSFSQSLDMETEKYQDQRSSQEKDIEDLANLFKNQLTQVGDSEDSKALVPEPQLKTTRHMLSSLPHYFQGQYDAGFETIVQYHMLSDQAYSGYIIVKDGDCHFNEGTYPGAEVELTAQETVIEDILTKKVTAQKAFMLGQLKVRGNFMLLSKIDQMFKAM